VQTIVTDVRGVCLSVCLSRMHRMTPLRLVVTRLHCAGSLGAAFVKLYWPLVVVIADISPGTSCETEPTLGDLTQLASDVIGSRAPSAEPQTAYVIRT